MSLADRELEARAMSAVVWVELGCQRLMCSDVEQCRQSGEGNGVSCGA